MFINPLARGAAVLAAALTLSSPAFAVPASNEASARAFVQKLYSKHAGAEGAVYDAGLLALIKKDRRLAHGEVGALDFDPVCQCQDDGGMKSEILDVHATAKSAVVHVRLTFTEAQPVEVIPVEFDLVRVAAGWRVHDIKSKTTPSLVAYMRAHAGGK